MKHTLLNRVQNVVLIALVRELQSNQHIDWNARGPQAMIAHYEPKLCALCFDVQILPGLQKSGDRAASCGGGCSKRMRHSRSRDVVMAG